MPEASPAKWHLAHTTWFFETFVLGRTSAWSTLFNSYYDAIGERVDRARRGTLSRPTLDQVLEYRGEIDREVERCVSDIDPSVVELGLHHEQQHQELLLTDIKHALGTQPSRPAYRDDLVRESTGSITTLAWVDFDEAVVEIGADDRGFAFDNERPRHKTFVHAFQLAARPITNAEVLAFIFDGGYRDHRHWLSDGYATARAQDWCAPLYWELRNGMWMLYDLTGLREVDPAETACHLSYYEADAIARWAGARLPTEAEWECAAQAKTARDGHFADDDRLHPLPASGGLSQLFGDVWEWTQSAYAPYPGFRPLAGALGEYNGKFMSGQMVLRGGSCLTPRGHVRASYRNFFAPSARWQMSGVRLANHIGAVK